MFVSEMKERNRKGEKETKSKERGGGSGVCTYPGRSTRTREAEGDRALADAVRANVLAG